MGRSLGGADASNATSVDGFYAEVPEHNAHVNPYYLDAFEVTVGRFRKFVDQFDGTPPAAGAGAHPLIPSSGWQSAWNSSFLADKATLLAALKNHTDPTWTDQVGANENFAINLVDWYIAFAFCAWDGGRLPTEAEWEFAAAGGVQNRLYPWGSNPASPSLANYSASQNSPANNVGIHPAGNGRWGHYDLAGNLWEWVLDVYDPGWYQSEGNPCNDCAKLWSGTTRVHRGGTYWRNADYMRAAHRSDGTAPNLPYATVGVRCARDAP